MTERDFEMLKVLSEMSNITKAAEKLRITQSALSKRIKALEDELGVQLLKRSRGGGRILQQKAKLYLNTVIVLLIN